MFLISYKFIPLNIGVFFLQIYPFKKWSLSYDIIHNIIRLCIRKTTIADTLCSVVKKNNCINFLLNICLLYTSDAADE